VDRRKLKNHDWLITIIAVFIQIIGIFIIFSTTFDPKNQMVLSQETIKQIIFLIVGLVIYLIISFIDVTWLENKNIILLLYAVIIALLIYVRFFGITINNTHRWISFGMFSLQPAEYAKLIVILLTAYINIAPKPLVSSYLLKIKPLELLINKFPIFKHRILTLLDNLILIAPIVVLILIQPALGNTIITILLWLLTMYVIANNKKRVNSFLGSAIIFIIIFLQIFDFSLQHNQLNFDLKDPANIGYPIIISTLIALFLFYRYYVQSIKTFFLSLLIVTLVCVTFTLSWNYNILWGYQQSRVINFLQGSQSDIANGNWQTTQSQVAIGSGMILGRGYLAGSQSALNILPEAHNDFIFASFAEQFGLVGATILLLLYVVIIMRIVNSAQHSKNEFGRNVSVGVSVLLLIHIFINIGMNLGKLPVTGIPLPLMSSGGSSILMTMIALSFVQSVNSSKRAVDFADNLVLRSASQIRKF
jgi:rod shape determining protein RodA